MEKQTLRQLLADYYDVSVDEVSPEQFDPAVKFLKEKHDAPSEVGVWVLDEETRGSLREYLDGRSSGELLEESDAESDPWDEFIYWARKFYEAPGFDENERSYKLEIGEKLRKAQDAVRGDAEDWQLLLKKAFGPPNNLTYYITHSRLLDWVAREPEVARGAILKLWDETAVLASRIDQFADALPGEIANPGSKVELAAFLLMVEPTNNVMYRPSPIKTAVALTDQPDIPSSPVSVTYLTAMAFFDTFVEEARRRSLDLRDRLDAQGLVWALTKTAPQDLIWSDEEVEAFLRYRGERPQIWWVNQGSSYSDELGGGFVSAGITNRAGQVLQHHKNVSMLRKGDIILHHAGGLVRAISVVSHKPEIKPRPTNPDGPDHRIARTTYFELSDPIEVRGLDAEHRTVQAGPFDKYGGVKQVYLVPVSVVFSDWLRESFSGRWPDGSPWASKPMNTWLFQANPEVWHLSARLQNMQTGELDDFSVSRFKTEYTVGDRLLLWQAGPEAGLYGLGQISGEVFERAPDDEHFTDPTDELAVPWRLVTKVDPPLLRERLLENPVLNGLSVITAPQGSNFRITDEQWSELKRLLDGESALSSSPTKRSLAEIGTFMADVGLIITDRTLRRFHVSLSTRGFVILSGISGTGKTWLTKAYADAVGADYLLVSVAPNWTTNEDLLGYLNPLDGVYHHTAFSEFLGRAAAEYEAATRDQRGARQFILALDEMNLARVEYYFAKFLSAMEVRTRGNEADIVLAPTQTVKLTPNLLFVGTVNVDETTHGFSDKVFDRAQLIELDPPRDAIANHIGTAAYRETFMDVYDAVEDAKPFAFRVVDDVKAYVAESETLDVEWHEAVDEQILQKILPKLSGADPAIRFALERMTQLADLHGFGLTQSKAKRMLDDFDRDGFTSYF